MNYCRYSIIYSPNKINNKILVILDNYCYFLNNNN